MTFFFFSLEKNHIPYYWEKFTAVYEPQTPTGFKVDLETAEDQWTKVESITVLRNHFNFLFPFFILWTYI